MYIYIYVYTYVCENQVRYPSSERLEALLDKSPMRPHALNSRDEKCTCALNIFKTCRLYCSALRARRAHDEAIPRHGLRAAENPKNPWTEEEEEHFTLASVLYGWWSGAPCKRTDTKLGKRRSGGISLSHYFVPCASPSSANSTSGLPCPKIDCGT